MLFSTADEEGWTFPVHSVQRLEIDSIVRKCTFIHYDRNLIIIKNDIKIIKIKKKNFFYFLGRRFLNHLDRLRFRAVRLSTFS